MPKSTTTTGVVDQLGWVSKGERLTITALGFLHAGCPFCSSTNSIRSLKLPKTRPVNLFNDMITLSSYPLHMCMNYKDFSIIHMTRTVKHLTEHFLTCVPVCQSF